MTSPGYTCVHCRQFVFYGTTHTCSATAKPPAQPQATKVINADWSNDGRIANALERIAVALEALQTSRKCGDA